MGNRSLAFKLNTSTIILLLLIAGVSIYSALMINKTQSYADDTGSNWLPSIAAIGELNRDLTNAPRRLAIYTLDWTFNLPENSKAKDAETLQKFISKLDQDLKAYPPLISGPDEQKIYDKCIATWKLLQVQIKENQALAESGEGVESFVMYHAKTLPLVLELGNNLVEMSDYNYNGGINSTKQGAYLTNLTNITMVSTIGASVIIALFIFQIIKKSTNLIETAIKNLKGQSISTNKIANDLKKGSQTLADSVSEQASSVHETSAAINQITSMVNRTAENARESTTVAKSASEKAEEGQKTMHKLVSAMETIQESNTQLQNIAVIINQINAKTAVINDIVSKTELLSLNASIESARAGEYGKGFAVVAEEVGNLAKVSGKSAHEIQELITASQEQVNKILGLTKERVDEGKKVTAEAQESFLKISEDISSMSGVIQQISEATKEQEIGVRQISTAMSQIDKATQNSKTAVNSTAESSAHLVEQSDKLDTTAQDISLLIMGSSK
jgi:methyl-accepting chemotaxis protein